MNQFDRGGEGIGSGPFRRRAKARHEIYLLRSTALFITPAASRLSGRVTGADPRNHLRRNHFGNDPMRCGDQRRIALRWWPVRKRQRVLRNRRACHSYALLPTGSDEGDAVVCFRDDPDTGTVTPTGVPGHAAGTACGYLLLFFGSLPAKYALHFHTRSRKRRDLAAFKASSELGIEPGQ
jgi:hypothetical protein